MVEIEQKTHKNFRGIILNVLLFWCAFFYKGIKKLKSYPIKGSFFVLFNEGVHFDSLTIEYGGAKEELISFVRTSRRARAPRPWVFFWKLGRAIHLVSDHAGNSIVRQAMTEIDEIMILPWDTARRWASSSISSWNMDVRYRGNESQLPRKESRYRCCWGLRISQK